MFRFASLPVLIVAGFCASHGFESRGFRFPRRGSIQIHELTDETILSWCVFVLCLFLFRSAVSPCFFVVGLFTRKCALLAGNVSF